MPTAIRSTKLIVDGEYAKTAQNAIKSATAEIRICAYDWRWYQNEPENCVQMLNTAICQAIYRGVPVRALVNSEENYRILKGFGVNVKFLGNDKILHVKAISVQDDVLLLGSHNLTKRANSQNYEVSVAIYDMEPILQFNAYFDKIWGYARGGV